MILPRRWRIIVRATGQPVTDFSTPRKTAGVDNRNGEFNDWTYSMGVVLAAMLFGLLYQGGAELSFAKPAITRDMIVVIQGLIIMFAGALAYMNRPWVARAYYALRPAAAVSAAASRRW